MPPRNIKKKTESEEKPEAETTASARTSRNNKKAPESSPVKEEVKVKGSSKKMAANSPVKEEKKVSRNKQAEEDDELSSAEEEPVEKQPTKVSRGKKAAANKDEAQDEEAVATKPGRGKKATAAQEEPTKADKRTNKKPAEVESTPPKKAMRAMKIGKSNGAKKQDSSGSDEEEEAPGKSGKLKRRKHKDANAPKRAGSAYTYFMQEFSKTIREQNPSIEAKHVMGEAGKAWAKLTDKDKKPYEEKAAAEKERYQKEMENYVPTAPVDKGDKPKKAKKDPNAPKRNASAYILFTQKEGKKIREANPEMGAKDVMKEAASRWNNLPDEDKKALQSQAAKDKIRYDKEMSAYRQEQVA